MTWCCAATPSGRGSPFQQASKYFLWEEVESLSLGAAFFFFSFLKHAGVPRMLVEIIDYKSRASIALQGGGLLAWMVINHALIHGKQWVFSQTVAQLLYCVKQQQSFAADVGLSPG